MIYVPERVIITPNLYFGGPRSKSRLGDRFEVFHGFSNFLQANAVIVL